jgi:hypothetical protein
MTMRLFSLFSLHLVAASLSVALPSTALALDATAPLLETRAGQQQEMLKGAQAFFEGVNLRGGIHGRPIHLARSQISNLPGGELSSNQGVMASGGTEVRGAALGFGGLYELRPEFDAQVSRMVDQLFELNAQGSSAIDHTKVFGKQLPRTMHTTDSGMGRPQPTDTSYGLVREYQDAMNTAGYHHFSAGSLEGYINAKVVADGLRRAGRAVVSSLDTSRHYDLGGIAVAIGNRSTQTVRLAALASAQKPLNF